MPFMKEQRVIIAAANDNDGTYPIGWVAKTLTERINGGILDLNNSLADDIEDDLDQKIWTVIKTETTVSQLDGEHVMTCTAVLELQPYKSGNSGNC